MKKKLLIGLIPELKGKFKSNLDENSIGAYEKNVVYIQCLGKNCGKYVSKKPNNIIRDFVKYNQPSIDCDNALCQKQKPKIKRKPKVGNSIKELMPVLAKQLCPPCVSIVVTSPEIRNLNRGRSVSDQWPAIQKSSKSPSFRR